MSRRKTASILTLTALVLMGCTAQAQLDKLLKVGGIAYVVSHFGPDIDKFINRLTKTTTTEEFDTKVVPVLSEGNGGFVGAVQVAGPRSQVEKVQAVAQIEGKFNPLGMRVRALIPIASNDIKNIRRVPGVGVSGLLDVKI